LEGPGVWQTLGKRKKKNKEKKGGKKKGGRLESGKLWEEKKKRRVYTYTFIHTGGGTYKYVRWGGGLESGKL
jgi:hypothetical protein